MTENIFFKLKFSTSCNNFNLNAEENFEWVGLKRRADLPYWKYLASRASPVQLSINNECVEAVPLDDGDLGAFDGECGCGCVWRYVRVCVRAYQCEYVLRENVDCGDRCRFLSFFSFILLFLGLDISAKSSLFLFITVVIVVVAAAVALLGRLILFVYSEMCC